MKSRFFYVISVCMALILVQTVRGQGTDQATSVSENSAKSEVSSSNATDALPEEDKTISMARADWDTGWFQAEMFKQLLEELGYTVKGPATMHSWDFYLSAARGEIDMWVNGWFPSNYFEDERIRDKVEAVGFEVKAGALPDCLVDKKPVDALGINNPTGFSFDH